LECFYLKNPLLKNFRSTGAFASFASREEDDISGVKVNLKQQGKFTDTL